MKITAEKRAYNLIRTVIEKDDTSLNINHLERMLEITKIMIDYREGKLNSEREVKLGV